MNLWKLTTQDRRTYGGLQWEPGVWQDPLPGTGRLCSGSWYHAYQCEDPWLALLMNPVHGNIENPLLWRAEGRGNFCDDRSLKCGFSEMRIVGEPVHIVAPTTIQRWAFAIYCAGQVTQDETWQEWAARWLDGTDRTTEAGRAAELAVSEEARAAMWATMAAGAALEEEEYSGWSDEAWTSTSRYAIATTVDHAAMAAEDPKALLANAIAWARTVT